MQIRCPKCGLPLELEDGWSYGSIPLAYGLVGLFWVLPLCVLTLLGWLSVTLAVILGIVGVVLLPIITYRFTKCLWTGLYYAILPAEIGEDGASPDRDELSQRAPKSVRASAEEAQRKDD